VRCDWERDAGKCGELNAGRLVMVETVFRRNLQVAQAGVHSTMVMGIGEWNSEGNLKVGSRAIVELGA